MEIPDSDEEEGSLPDTAQNDNPNHQDQPISLIQFIECILFQLNNINTTPPQHQHQQQNPFSTLSTSQLFQAKPLMLTLHCLFPNELLLALDILDRGLVRRLEREDQQEVHRGCDAGENTPYCSPDLSSPSTRAPAPGIIESVKEPVEAVLFVISASTTSTSTSTRQVETKGYEVRLSAWNCTCATFTISAFRGDAGSELNLESHHHDQGDGDKDDINGRSTNTAEEGHRRTYCFGGTLTRGPTSLSPPMCKHLLACILLVRCPRLFGTEESTEQRRISAKELAGWCAGWGG